ncbi:MAG: methionine synthase [Actinobacteria bacterium]|nr:MAG: methionine synthase [Actinomycetota bacterium]
MKERPLRTTVVGSYPFPGWLEHASSHLDDFGPDDLAELVDDAVLCAIHDQVEAGLDVITDGEQTRLDFNLSFYGYLEGIERESAPARRLGPPAHDQRARHTIVGELAAPRGLGVVEEWERLRRLAPPGPALKASVPGPYTLSGRLVPNERYPNRDAVAEALWPIVAAELEALVAAGCGEITVDEPSMSCYAYRADTSRLVDLFNRTTAPVRGRARLSTHLCFGNYKGRAVGPRRYAPMFPAFLELDVDEIHVEMASRELAESEIVGTIAERLDVAVGIVDVKSYWIEPPEEVARRVRHFLRFAPSDRLSFAPDCGLSQTARWAARQKLANLVRGVAIVREEVGA